MIHQQRVSSLRVALRNVPLTSPALTLEIGCGHGHFLTAYAATRPDEQCVAIDIIKERLDKATRKSTSAKLNNITWLRAAADDFFEALPAEVRFTRHIFILFPDPWPKRKHWKNRLIQRPFLDTLARHTTLGTRLCFRTDHDPYFEQAAAEIRSHLAWQERSAADWPFEQRTVFEARAPNHNSLVAERVGEAAPGDAGHLCATNRQ